MTSISTETRIKHFFAAFFALFLLAGLGIFIIASQNKTNTESNASGSGCTNKPTLKYIDSMGMLNGVKYHYKLKNNCPNPKIFFIEAGMPTKPVNYDNVWFYNFENKSGDKNYGYDYTNWINPDNKDGEDIYLFVGRFSRKVGSSRIPIPAGKYSYVSVKASLEKNPSISDTASTYYYVEN